MCCMLRLLHVVCRLPSLHVVCRCCMLSVVCCMMRAAGLPLVCTHFAVKL
jgi:hypothetical protein